MQALSLCYDESNKTQAHLNDSFKNVGFIKDH